MPQQYKYSRDDYYKITNAPCIDVALALGMEINTKASDSKSWKMKGEQGLCIFRDGNNWYRFSDGKGGFPIDLVKDKLGYNNEQALDFIARYVVGVSEQTQNISYNRTPPQKKLPKEKSEFVVPSHAVQPKRVMAYLIKTRGIDPDIVKAMIQRKMIAEDDVHHNCLFFGKDADNNIKSCSMRGTMSIQFRGEVPGGDKKYTFEMRGKNDVLRLFESPIDAMSHATFSKLLGRDWTSDHRLSVNGAGTYDCIKRYINEHPEINTVWFSYDNDEGGQKGTRSSIAKLQQDFPERNLDIRIYFPLYGKDWNEDLQKFRSLEPQGVNVVDFVNSRLYSQEASDGEDDEEDFEP